MLTLKNLHWHEVPVYKCSDFSDENENLLLLPNSQQCRKINAYYPWNDDFFF